VLQDWVILLVAFSYLSVLFAIAYYGDKRADEKRSLIANPYIYALSIAVYCTSWTFYGSVGRAASTGVGFLPIYLGPTLTFLLAWFVLRKIVRISKTNRITSIADFISSRYGKSPLLGGLVSVIAVVGIMPYISLQLKAISTSFTVLLQYPELVMPQDLASVPVLQDTALYVTLIMVVFAILFGTRHIDASEHHEGMVAAIAFESVVKLLAFLAVGVFVTYQVYRGFSDIFAQAAAIPEMARLLTMEAAGGYGSWLSLTLLSMAAIICLPRQFQVAVVENVDEAHLKKAIWLFPLYLFAINIFVLPIAFGGLLHFPDGQVDADTFVLTIPMAERHELLALFAFIGGLSAATGMIIVASIALSTMVCNDLVMPVLLRVGRLHLKDKGDLPGLLLGIRRGSILAVLLLGYLYMRLIGESYALVSIGLVSFAAAAQFAPAIVGGIFWKGANRAGALAGLTAGFLVWAYTLLLPSFARSGWLPQSFVDEGAFGLALFRPYELFGLTGLDHISHALFWSMVANLGLYVGVSLLTRQGIIERGQAVLFVDAFSRADGGSRVWRGTATVRDLRDLLGRFVGHTRTQRAFSAYARSRGLSFSDGSRADAEWVQFAERQLAGAIGAASARIMVATVVQEEPPDIDQVMEILDEASQVIEYSRRLEEKSRELEAASSELRAANVRLQELDKLKDDFVSTVSHELRTPLTSIRSFSEILYDTPGVDEAKKREFLGIIIAESERLTRLINDMLDLAKMEAGKLDWYMEDIDPGAVIVQAVAATGTLFSGKRPIALEIRMPDSFPKVHADTDRLTQVIVNLMSNAAKFCDRAAGKVAIEAAVEPASLRISVWDNGPGIRPADRHKIFEKFQQAGDTLTDKPQGTGLGLPICREIVEHFGGRLWVAGLHILLHRALCRVPGAE
jgi:Na+/proline symporter/nitrogen-specific signal transduction histidine kinase